VEFLMEQLENSNKSLKQIGTSAENEVISLKQERQRLVKTVTKLQNENKVKKNQKKKLYFDLFVWIKFFFLN
jgi:hypothetical protein